MKTIFLTLIISLLASSGALAKGGGRHSSSHHSGGGHSGGNNSGTSHSNSSHSASGTSHATKGYVKKDGTHVAPAHATNPNDAKSDNWSSKGNKNPYTGKDGTKDSGAGN